MDCPTDKMNRLEILETIVRRQQAALDAKESELEEMRALLQIDTMTGLFNRAGFFSRTSAMTSQQSRDGGSTFLVFIDVDNFKRLNTSFGHDGGDFALITLATRFKAAMRAHDIVARWSGDEFVIAFQLHSMDVAAGTHSQIFARLAEFIQQPIDFSGQSMDVTCSIGVVRYDGREIINIDDFIKASNTAMFDAKISGKNSTVEIEYLPATG